MMQSKTIIFMCFVQIYSVHGMNVTTITCQECATLQKKVEELKVKNTILDTNAKSYVNKINKLAKENSMLNVDNVALRKNQKIKKDTDHDQQGTFFDGSSDEDLDNKENNNTVWHKSPDDDIPHKITKDEKIIILTKCVNNFRRKNNRLINAIDLQNNTFFIQIKALEDKYTRLHTNNENLKKKIITFDILHTSNKRQKTIILALILLLLPALYCSYKGRSGKIVQFENI